MKRQVLIIYPHWPPSNLVGVHRVRLIANNLSLHGWHPVVLTVHEDHYEEQGSPELVQLVSESVEVIKVAARKPWQIGGVRLAGDIGIRAFQSLQLRALELCRERSIDFIWISMPSWYPSLLGPRLKKKTGVPYGIDYQDPWIHPLPPGAKPLSRAGLTRKVGLWLEPKALKYANLVTGINRPYFQGALERNPNLEVQTAAFQLGFDAQDHAVKHPTTPPWDSNRKVALYPGAFLPLSAPFHRAILAALRSNREKGLVPHNALMCYIGTGHPDKPISKMARELGVEDMILEIPNRIPFLEIQQLLRNVHGNLVIGSPEPHYSASKVFQSILSNRPTLALLHQDSEALDILRGCSCSEFAVGYCPEDSIWQSELETALAAFWEDRPNWSPNTHALAPYSAYHAAGKLATAMEKCMS